MESDKKQTAVEYLIKEFSDILGKIKTNPMQDFLIIDAINTAKKMERVQHGNTWDAAIKAHEDCGYVLARSICDFDDYVIS